MRGCFIYIVVWRCLVHLPQKANITSFASSKNVATRGKNWQEVLSWKTERAHDYTCIQAEELRKVQPRTTTSFNDTIFFNSSRFTTKKKSLLMQRLVQLTRRVLWCQRACFGMRWSPRMGVSKWFNEPLFFCWLDIKIRSRLEHNIDGLDPWSESSKITHG